jgi:hypothetical protein
MHTVDHTQSLDAACTSELVMELLNRIELTNGLECTSPALLAALATLATQLMSFLKDECTEEY